MRVLVIGANGLTGRRVVRLLDEGSHQPVAMIRDPDQAPGFDDAGIDPVVAAEANGVSRYVMLSSRGADPESDREALEAL